MIRVAIVDDQGLVRDGFAMILGHQSDMEIVLQADNGAPLLAAVTGGASIDVVLLDLQMAGVDGIETTRRLQGIVDAPKVLVLTTFDDEPLIRQALVEGAAGYLLKRATAAQLVDAVRTTHAGGSVLTPTVASTVLGWLRSGQSVAAEPVAEVPTGLTARELEVLHLVGEGLSNTEIATRLFLSTSTVKKHVTAVLAKTGARDRVNVALIAQQLGRPGLGPTSR